MFLAAHRRSTGVEEERVTPRPPHEPVLLDETLERLAARPGDVVVDATLGPGGHAEALLEAVGPRGRVIGIDRDGATLAAARRRLARFGDAFVAVHGHHRDVRRIVEGTGVDTVQRVLFDLGISSAQLDDPARGFSLRGDGPLDMRMDPRSGPTAADLLATLSEGEIAGLLWRFGEERRARAIARAIVERREIEPLVRTRQLAELVERVAGRDARRYRIHPATRTFQALRIAVNGELDHLAQALVEGIEILEAGGRIAVITFHSLEDRVVKRTFRSLAKRCTCPPRLPVCGCGRPDLVRAVTARPARPTAAEIARNPRARSAKLRVAEKL
jgi:16S rRNA (cytosine1402-N4)-methyltransferase